MTSPLARALREHGDALAATIDTLAQLDADGWVRPWGRGKWSAGQIAEHLTLVYEHGIRDLRGGEPIRARVGPGWQAVLRTFVLPHILFHRNFPVRAHAPRQWRPTGEPAGGAAMAGVLEALSDAAQRFESEAARAVEEGRSLRHPYFGRVDALRALRLCAVHLEHHRRQILRCLSRDRAPAAAR